MYLHSSWIMNVEKINGNFQSNFPLGLSFDTLMIFLTNFSNFSGQRVGVWMPVSHSVPNDKGSWRKVQNWRYTSPDFCEGKSKIQCGSPKTECNWCLLFQILRNHVMVRVGGGWDTLQHYLDKHDPCRCNAGKQKPIFQISAPSNGYFCTL